MKKLLVPLVLLGFLLGAETTLADRDDHRGYDRGHDRDFRGNQGNWNRAVPQRWDNRRDSGRNYSRNYGRDQRRYDDRDVSISLSIGNITRPYFGSSFGTGFGINTWSGFGPSWNRPVRIYNQRPPVVIYQNTYINRSAPVVERSTSGSSYPSVSGTSLLRDLSGRCFERDFDSRGNETRLELPASACNF